MSLVFSRVFVEIPLLNGTGNYFGGTGIFFDATQGILRAEQGNSFWWGHGAKLLCFLAWMEF
jgi:hypothetical protein